MLSGTNSARTLGIGLGLGIIALVLVYGHSAGLGVTLYLLVLIGMVFANARLNNRLPRLRNLPLLVPVLFFAIMPVIRADQFLLGMNFVAGLCALLLFTYFFAGGNVAVQGLLDYPVKVLISAADVLFQPFAEFAESRKWFSGRRDKLRGVGPVLRGAAITVPLVGMFVVLLSSADAIFGKVVSDVLGIFKIQNLPDATMRAVFVAMMGWGAIGILSTSLMDRRKLKRTAAASGTPESEPQADAEAARGEDQPLPTPSLRRFVTLGFTETTMALGGVCAVFGAFVAIQFVYLFGGVRNITNFSYAEYVHRGFTELVIVAVLTLGLIFLLNAVTLRKTAREITVFRALGTCLIVLTGVILVSAFQRLRLYELTYGFTSLRLAIYVTILWLGVLFAGMALSLYWSPATVRVFESTALIAAFGFVATLNILNPDAFVARQNVSRGDLDPRYLATLSVEAVPELVGLVDAPEPGVRSIVRDALKTWWDNLTWYRNTDWRDYNVAFSAADAQIEPVLSKLSDVQTNEYDKSAIMAFIKPGMTTRDVIRQFAFPSYVYTIGDSGGVRYTLDMALTYRLVYHLTNNEYLSLVFDTADGLQSTMNCTNLAECSEAVPVR